MEEETLLKLARGFDEVACKLASYFKSDKQYPERLLRTLNQSTNDKYLHVFLVSDIMETYHHFLDRHRHCTGRRILLCIAGLLSQYQRIQKQSIV